jgi:hypothetical protein
MPPQALPPLTALAGAAFGGWAADGSFSLTTQPALVGGVAGLLLGAALARDSLAVRRRVDEAGSGTTDPAPPAPARPSGLVAGVMLALPVVAGVLLWQQEAVGLTDRAARLLGGGTVLATAVLGYVDTRWLVLGRPAVPAGAHHPADPPAIGFVGMLAMWVLCYPVHFFGRRRFGGTNLVVPGLVATAVFVGPSVARLFADPELPPADSPEVVDTLRRAVEDGPEYRAGRLEYGRLSVRGATETEFDRDRQVRTGRATLVTNVGREEVAYAVEWADRRNGVWQVRSLGPP